MNSESSISKPVIASVLGGGVLLVGLVFGLQSRQDIPGRVVMATGSSHYYELAESYRKDLERNGVEYQIRRSTEGFQTLRALADPKGDINAGFVKGGLVGSMQGRLASEKAKNRHAVYSQLMSVGRLFLEPVWVFTRGDLPIRSLRDLEGKRILVGTRESGTRRIASQLLRANGVTRDNATLLEEELGEDAAQLTAGYADSAVLILPADAERIQQLLRVPNIRLMDFSEEAEAYANRFPALAKVVLRQGAVEFKPLIPTDDITLLATSVALVVRRDMDPALVSLLTHAIYMNPKSGFDRQGDPVLFYKAGEFPNVNDPEFEVSNDARVVYKSGELPYMLRALAPISKQAGIPFSMTAFANAHWPKLVLLIPALAVILPLTRFLPAFYTWTVRRRLIYWYRQLKALERSLDSGAAKYDLAALQAEIDRIESAVRSIRVPLYFSHQLYDLRGHIELVRQRIAARPEELRMAAE